MAGIDRGGTRLTDVRARSWLWRGAACVLIGVLGVVFLQRRAEAAAPVKVIESPAETGAEIVVARRANAGTARSWTRTIGVLALVTAAIFIYSAAR